MRILPVAAFLTLCACSTDVFTSSDAADDSGHDGAASDAIVSDAVGSDSGSGDAISSDAPPPPASIQCNPSNSTQCTPQQQLCCGNADWTASSCTPTSGCTGISQHPLACDDVTDCPSGICCATATDAATTTVTGSSCQQTCGGSDIQLCKTSTECLAGLCSPITAGTPSWLERCQ